MKPHILPQQLNDLSEVGTERFKRYFIPKPGDWYIHPDGDGVEIYDHEDVNNEVYIRESLLLPNVLNLIEFLTWHDNDFSIRHITNTWTVDSTKYKYDGLTPETTPDYWQLVDTLWHAVAFILNNELELELKSGEPWTEKLQTPEN